MRRNIFDARWIGPHGIGRFALELKRRLLELESIKLGGRPSGPLDPFILAGYLSVIRPDVFFSPGYNAPFGRPCPFVFCIHDLNHLVIQENSSALKRRYYRHILLPAVHKARSLLTVSEFSRQAIAEWAGIDCAKVVNVSNGISAAFSPHGAVYQGSSRPYFLYVGNHRPHKNIRRLLRAYAACGLRGEVALVSTGRPNDGLQHEIESLRLSEDVSFVGEVTDDQLAELYRGALGLVLVSLYEGFGLPIVEAMACGTPVLASSVASMPEVAGGAALLVDPLDEDAIADGLVRLAMDSRLREQLRSYGLLRACDFSWEGTAQKVQNALLTAVEEG